METSIWLPAQGDHHDGDGYLDHEDDHGGQDDHGDQDDHGEHTVCGGSAVTHQLPLCQTYDGGDDQSYLESAIGYGGEAERHRILFRHS